LRKSVCYFYRKAQTATVFEANESVKTFPISDNFEGALASEVDFLLIDPPENGDPNFLGGRSGLKKKKFILAISPDRNNCQAIRKDTSTVAFYMGSCPLQEAEEMRLSCYDHVTHERLVSRFNEFGGIPRYLFKAVFEESSDLALDEVRSQQRSALVDMINNPNRIDDMENSDPFKSLLTLYHMEPMIYDDNTVDYHKYTIQPCCQKASTKIRDQLMKKSVKDLWNTYMSTREELGTLRGIRYEAYAHKKILIDGLAGSATKLTQNGTAVTTPKTISIPAGSELVNLPNNQIGQLLKTIVQKARTGQGGYLLPQLPNFPVVDSIFVPRGDDAAILLQIKCGRSRSLATDKAESIFAATGSTDIYFIAPDDVTVTRKLQGFDRWHQYRVVLKETI
jgi:hypothetical protein